VNSRQRPRERDSALPARDTAELTPRCASRRIDSMLRSGATHLVLLGTALAALLGADPAAADLWRWIDADGVPRYTPDPDRVPSAQRSTLARVEPGMASTPQREPAVAKPPAIFAPPGDPAVEADPWNEPERAREIQGEVVVEIQAAEPLAPASEPPAPASEPPAPASAPVPSGEAEPLRSVDAAPAAPAAPQSARVVAPQAEPTAAPATERTAAPRRPAVAPQPAPSDAPARPPEIQGEIVVEVPAAEPPAPAPGQAEAPGGAEPLPSIDAAAPLAAAPQAARAVAAPAERTAAARPAPAVAAPGVPAASGAKAAAPAPLPPDLAARRTELLAAIARDEEALKAHVSSRSDGQLAASAELREIAERLPALQAELRALEAQTAAP